MVSIQSSYTSLSKCICSSLFGNLMSCSLLTSWLCSLRYFFYGNVIYGSTGVCLATCTIIGTTLTVVGFANGSIMPLIIFCALKFILSCFLFAIELEAPPSSTLFFLLKTLLGEFVATFFLFFSVVYISSLVLLTLRW